MCPQQIKFKCPSTFAKDFFISHLPEYKGQVIDIQRIDFGFSNNVFLFKTPDEKEFKVRITKNNHIISRKNEQIIGSLIQDKTLLFYDTTNGNAIYSWIDGTHMLNMKLTKEHLVHAHALAKGFYDTKISDKSSVLEHDDLDYFDDAKENIPIKYQDKYLLLIAKHKNLKKVLCHNDISLKNLIIKDDKISLIDYEWGRLNSIQWDMGNLIRESHINAAQIYELSQIANLDHAELLDFCFIATYYSLQLSFQFPETDLLENYRIQLLSQLETYGSRINN